MPLSPAAYLFSGDRAIAGKIWIKFDWAKCWSNFLPWPIVQGSHNSPSVMKKWWCISVLAFFLFLMMMSSGRYFFTFVFWWCDLAYNIACFNGLHSIWFVSPADELIRSDFQLRYQKTLLSLKENGKKLGMKSIRGTSLGVKKKVSKKRVQALVLKAVRLVVRLAEAVFKCQITIYTW